MGIELPVGFGNRFDDNVMCQGTRFSSTWMKVTKPSTMVLVQFDLHTLIYATRLDFPV